MKIAEDLYLVGSGRYGLSHEFDCNIYLVVFDRQLILIDAGAGVKPELITENIKKEGLNPSEIEKVFLTHSHADHVAGGAYFQKEFSCEVFAPEGADSLISSGTEEELGLQIAKRSGLYSPEYQPPRFEVDQTLKHKQTVSLGSAMLTSILVPGHSRYSSCFLIEGDRARTLFTGDSVFFNGKIGLLNCPGSSLSNYRKHIQRLGNLGVERLLPGHGIFTLSRGQDHLNKAISFLEQINVPPLHGPTSGKADI